MSELTNSATILNTNDRGESRISWKEVRMYKGVCSGGGGGGGVVAMLILSHFS